MTDVQNQEKSIADQGIAAVDNADSIGRVSAAQNRTILLKTDLIVLPLMTLTTTLASLDKSSIAFAAVWGFKTDTNLKGQEYSWLGSIFYFGHGLLSGVMSHAIGKINGTLETWKYIFLIYGAFTMGYGILVFFSLPDRPEKAWFFSSEEKKAAVIRTAENQTEAKTRRGWKTAQILEAVRDSKYWCIVVFCIAQSIANAGITNVTSFNLLSIGICLPLADIETQSLLPLAGLYLTGFWHTPFVLMLSLQTSNTAGETKKSFCSVSVAAFYAIGNIVGPQFFLESQSPHYSLGINAMMCCFAIMVATGMLYAVVCIFENRRRDRVHGPPIAALEDPRLSTEAEEQTDFRNTNFRYVY
ncbi:MFS transporter [Lasiodiplodia theobromae]|uniref:MFS transporter n=1 Tax=Lasiodiplodia theobromae TaxID=45133 RepID=UPI0015C3D732|nr:MFS transporter [Lasiodiplodia theobromae]KAF4535375.1 MFS transporter [Lasiodiplodia theobromae]